MVLPTISSQKFIHVSRLTGVREKSNRIGFKLTRTLVRKQLHGNVQITSIAGFEGVREFPINQGESDYGTGTVS